MYEHVRFDGQLDKFRMTVATREDGGVRMTFANDALETFVMALDVPADALRAMSDLLARAADLTDTETSNTRVIVSQL